MRRIDSGKCTRVWLVMAGMLGLLPLAAAQTNAQGAEYRAASEQLREVLRRGDVEGLTEMYTPDAQLILSGKTIVGRDAIRTHAAVAVAAGVRDFRLEDQEFFPGDGTAVETGRAMFYDATGKLLGTSRYMTLWKKTEGGWRIHRDIGVPVPAAAGAPEQASGQAARPFGVKEVEPYSAIVLPMSGSFSQTSDALSRVAASLGVPPAGPAFGRYFNSPDSVPEAELKWEVGLPVPKGATAAAPFQVREFPAETVAFVVVGGPYEASRPWPQFVQWIVDHGYQVTGPAMEIWMDGPKTEMRIPVSKPGSR